LLEGKKSSQIETEETHHSKYVMILSVGNTPQSLQNIN
jgi:hypothetical protein